jgi:hypothetical protein
LQKSKSRVNYRTPPSLALLVFVLCLHCPAQTPADDLYQPFGPAAEIMLPEDEVKDRFFAYLIGLAEADAYGELRSEDLDEALREFAGKTRVPFNLITDIQRRPGEPGKPDVVSISFLDMLKTPVPYSILGYHPGSVVADTAVSFYEYYLPKKSVWLAKNSQVTLTQIHVFAVYEGWVVVDIDAWVDKILGGRLDDTWLTVLGLFKYEGDWHGIAAGYGPSGEGRSGVFNFKTNNILFPTPEQFRTLGPYFRNLVRSQRGIKAPLPAHGEWIEK